MSFPTPDKIHDATLTGVPLMLVMLACFLVGALCARLALELDVRALWDVIRRKAPKEPEAAEAVSEVVAEETK